MSDDMAGYRQNREITNDSKKRKERECGNCMYIRSIYSSGRPGRDNGEKIGRNFGQRRLYTVKIVIRDSESVTLLPSTDHRPKYLDILYLRWRI